MESWLHMTSMEDWDNTEDGVELSHVNFWTYDGSNNQTSYTLYNAYNGNLSSINRLIAYIYEGNNMISMEDWTHFEDGVESCHAYFWTYDESNNQYHIHFITRTIAT